MATNDDFDDAGDVLNLDFLDSMEDEELQAFAAMIGPVWDRMQKLGPSEDLSQFAAFGALVEIVRDLAAEIDQDEAVGDDEADPDED